MRSSQQSFILYAAVFAVVLVILDGAGKICSAFSFDTTKRSYDTSSGIFIPSTTGPITAESLSQKSVTKAAYNNHIMSTTTRRDTIKMPSQTPMVPWKVSCCACVYPQHLILLRIIYRFIVFLFLMKNKTVDVDDVLLIVNNSARYADFSLLGFICDKSLTARCLYSNKYKHINTHTKMNGTYDSKYSPNRD